MQSVCIYFKVNKVVMSSLSKSISGYWFMASHFNVVNDLTEQNIYSALITSFNESKMNVSDPADLKDAKKRLLALAKVRSLKQLREEYKYLMADFDGKVICFVPTKNLGDKEGYQELIGKKINVTTEMEVSEIVKSMNLAASYCE